MSSLYLGKISGKDSYEIHAFTKDLPFRDYTSSMVADSALFQKMLEGRYEVMEKGRPIYCTAINPDIKRRSEENPHDSREGTVHIAAVDSNGEIEAALSVAVDIGERWEGKFIGLPLENRYEANGYPAGASLDPFRRKYIRKMYNEDRDIQPYEMAELYRHYKRNPCNGLAPRFGLYTGWYHLGVREAINRGLTPSWLWVYDAVKEYFKLYKLVGAGVLRDLTIDKQPRLVSPGCKEIDEKIHDGQRSLFYRGQKISRTVRVPVPVKEDGKLRFKHVEIPFLDGVVDIRREAESIRKNCVFLSLKDLEGFSLKERAMLRIGLSVVGRRSFEQDLHPDSRLCRFINDMALKRTGITQWDFNGVGN
ncbi:MAG: hypothetical protein JXM72_10495 [Deltaproteobacteria bacterium]|nr:hypothetical protein [Deltaproteobacteria bacterium]